MSEQFDHEPDEPIWFLRMYHGHERVAAVTVTTTSGKSFTVDVRDFHLGEMGSA